MQSNNNTNRKRNNGRINQPSGGVPQIKNSDFEVAKFASSMV